MPKIRLKPKSVEFDDAEQKKPQIKVCDMPYCRETGEHKAPKDRSLSDYYVFCREHAQDYNKSWDFFSGMSTTEIEEHLIRSALWDRPTWRFTNFQEARDTLYRQAWQTYNFSESEPKTSHQHRKQHENEGERSFHSGPKNTPVHEALAIMGLEPPLNIDVIKKRYKTLAKKHHPDINKGNKKSEELLKSINMAYTVLKLAYQDYEKLAER